MLRVGDNRGMDPQPELALERAPSWDRPLVLVPSFSVAANLYVLVLGGALTWLGLGGRTAKRPSPWRLGGAARWWLLPTVIFLVVELVSFLYGSTDAHPTLSVLMADPLTQYPV